MYVVEITSDIIYVVCWKASKTNWFKIGKKNNDDDGVVVEINLMTLFLGNKINHKCNEFSRTNHVVNASLKFKKLFGNIPVRDH